MAIPVQEAPTRYRTMDVRQLLVLLGKLGIIHRTPWGVHLNLKDATSILRLKY